MMSSDIFFLVYSRITAVLEVHTQINLQGYFFYQSLFNFQGASHTVLAECLTNISQQNQFVNTFFARFLMYISTVPCVSKMCVSSVLSRSEYYALHIYDIPFSGDS